MRFVKQPEELRIYGAEAKQLILRFQPVALSTLDCDHDALDLAIDVSACGVGPYRHDHPPAVIRLGRDDCHNLLRHLTTIHRSEHPSTEKIVMEGSDGLQLTLRSGIERWTQPRPYTELMFDGVVLWPAPQSKDPDYRLFVWLYPEMLAKLIAALSDLLLPPEQRRVAVPSLKPSGLLLDPVEYALGS